VLFLLAVTVRRDSATRLGYGFDHRVRTVRIAAVNPDRLALTVGALEPNIATPN
jgi:Mg-chelatase subunit ChlI